MNKVFNSLIFSVLLLSLFISCQNNSGNKKVEPINTDQLASEINKNLPVRSTEKEHPGKAVYSKYCLTCHQSDGSGVPNMDPEVGLRKSPRNWWPL
jgi:cytochrome c5